MVVYAKTHIYAKTHRLEGAVGPVCGVLAVPVERAFGVIVRRLLVAYQAEHKPSPLSDVAMARLLRGGAPRRVQGTTAVARGSGTRTAAAAGSGSVCICHVEVVRDVWPEVSPPDPSEDLGVTKQTRDAPSRIGALGPFDSAAVPDLGPPGAIC